MTLAGGCEIALHADHVQAAAETYIGLVEMGIGVIPAGGGTKEMAKRASDAYFSGDIQLPTLKERYLNIGMAKVATSAQEAIELDLLLKNRDKVTVGFNNLIADANQAVLNLANQGAAFINYTAHGWESGWADPEFDLTDANNMTNNHKYNTNNFNI